MFQIAGGSFACKSLHGGVRGYARRGRAAKVRKSVGASLSKETSEPFGAKGAKERPSKSALMRNLSYGIIPLVLGLVGFIYTQMEPNNRPKLSFDYTRIRNKWFSWVDGQSSLSDNPQLAVLSAERHVGEREENEEAAQEISSEQSNENIIFNEEAEREALNLKQDDTQLPPQ